MLTQRNGVKLTLHFGGASKDGFEKKFSFFEKNFLKVESQNKLSEPDVFSTQVAAIKFS